MKYVLLYMLLWFASSACAEQTRPDLYNCEGCEAIYEHDFDSLSWETVLTDPDEPGEPMEITGVIFESDGTTPAPDVIVYAYQTNAAGVYATRGDETGWGRRHGYLRGWLKTDENGRYQIRSVRPGAYPSRSDPAHVHLTVKEPERQEYWIDSIHFTGDPLLTKEKMDRMENRGGSGIISLTWVEGIWKGERNIVLER